MARVQERKIEILYTTVDAKDESKIFPYSTEELNQQAAATLSSALSGAIANLTTNSYIDTNIIDTLSLNELAS